MDSQRNILLIGLALVSFLLFQQWQVAKNPEPQDPTINLEGLVANSYIQNDIPAPLFFYY